MIRCLFTFLFLCSGIFVAAQNTTDSLLTVANKNARDTATISAYAVLAQEMAYTDMDKGVSYARAGLALAGALNDSIWTGRCYYHLGLVYFSFGYNKEAIGCFDSAIVFLGNHAQSKYWVAKSLNGMGNAQRPLGRLKEATDSYLASKEIFEAIGDKKGIAGAYNNLGIIFMYEGQPEKALEYYRIAQRMNIEIGNKPWLAKNLSNMGTVFFNMKQYDSAEVYFRQSMAMSLEVGDEAGWALDVMNLGNVYTSKKNYEGAQRQFDEALNFYRANNYEADMAMVQYNLAGLYTATKDFEKAALYLDSAETISTKYGDLTTLIEIYEGYASMYEGTGDYKNAFGYYVRYATLRDSIMSSDMKNQMDQMEESLREEKLKEKNAALEQAKQLQDVQINRSNIIIASAAGGILLLVLLAFVIYKRYQLKTRANDMLRERHVEIQRQKEIIEQKNRDISDSINYAKKIQETVIPDETDFHSVYKDAFILYLPRNVVSGDFYWYALNGDKNHIAVADCTGHGVPGAFMSMIGIDKIQHAVVESKIDHPAKALAAVNRGLKLALRQHDDVEGMRDGMDIALISIDHRSMKLQYAGANRPVWLIRNKELIELSPSKVSIGGHTPGAYEFSSEEFDLQEGDCIYLFTDGYADQFGGPKGKKMMTRRFKELLPEVSHLHMSEQHGRLLDHFREWQGKLDQVDDVCVVAIRV